MNTFRILSSDVAEQNAAKLALVDGERRISYAELADAVRRITSALKQRWRVNSNDVVAVLAPNCAEFVTSYLAITAAGAIVQPIDPRSTAEEMRAAIVDSGARHLIIHRSLASKFKTIGNCLHSTERILGIGYVPANGDEFSEWLAAPVNGFEASDLGPGAIAELMYTSGTTAEPKGVMRTHANVVAAARNAILGFGYRKSDVIAIVMPLSHSSALNSQLLPLLQVGGTAVLLNDFDANRILSVLSNEGVTCLRMVPAMMRMLLANRDFNDQTSSSLRLLINSSATVDPETYRALKFRLPNVSLLNSYGLTEASTCTVLPDSMALSDADSIGQPIQGVEMCVRGEEEGTLPENVEGEICVRGDHVFVGYHRRPDATRAAFVDGWLRTGDLGRKDSRGFYYIHGRKSRFINCGGRKFSPTEVESCLLELPEIVEAAVVGTPHRILGEVGKAFVVGPMGSDLDIKKVKQHCVKRLASHKVPFSVVVVSELPRNSTGKLMHRKLAEIHS